MANFRSSSQSTQITVLREDLKGEAMSPVPTPRRALRRLQVATVLMVLVAGGLSSAGSATAAPAPQALPSPLRFTSSLDLECFRTNTYVPPAVTFLTRHLNPVLAGLPAENVTLGAREQLCVPVAKNDVIPPAGVIEFVRFVDLACYRITGTNVNTTLRLDHLNPVLADVPTKSVVITVPQQLCVPVIKNGLVPPDEVRRLVSFIDLKCYLEQPQTSLHKALILSHLNPVLANLPRHQADVTFNRQLCVPVAKGTQAIPADVLNIVRWIDLEKYDIFTPATTVPVNLMLRHLNPLFANFPAEPVTMQQSTHVLLPVAKNGVIPPA